MVVRNHSNTYQKHTILSTMCVQCNGASLCKRCMSNGSQAARQHANFFSADGASPQCIEACAFLGTPEAGGGDLRRVRTAICLPKMPAANAAACTSLQEHEDANHAIGGLGTRGSEGARRAADPWQRGGRRGRAAVRSKRLREEHTPVHLRRRQHRVLEREKEIRATCRPPPAATAVAKVALTAAVAAEKAAMTAAVAVAVEEVPAVPFRRI